jgi:hypothetical protein
MDLNADWERYCGIQEDNISPPKEEKICRNIVQIEEKEEKEEENEIAPKCSSLYISTKTQIAYLNMQIDLRNVFWKIPIIPYHLPAIGVVKKQMKFNSTSQAELDDIAKQSDDYDYVDQYIINQIINPEGRIKFKDTRKISIGLSRKDITSYRCKKKSAFYNCFVVIIRLLFNNVYKEIHVKVFNTGKLEIPGIQNEDILHQALTLLTDILRPIVVIPLLADPLQFMANKSETVLINSNFSCNYYIDREKLYSILKYKYKINSSYDSCSYPGIQCEFYYNQDNDRLLSEQTGKQPAKIKSANINSENIDTLSRPIIEPSVEKPHMKVSFMIFRTGSVLIVGKCTEPILYEIYDFLCRLFATEYKEIIGKNTDVSLRINSVDTGSGSGSGSGSVELPLKRVRKLRKKTILI